MNFTKWQKKLTCHFISYPSPETNQIKNASSQIYNIVSRKNSVKPIKKYLGLNFEEVDATNNRYKHMDDILLANICPIIFIGDKMLGN